MSTAIPTHTMTFLFTDIEGSTRLWEQHPEAMKAILAQHDALLRQAIEANAGRIVKTTGDGCMAVFEATANSLAAALSAQQALESESWSTIQPETIRVRIGIHTGESEARAGDFFGTSVNRAARLMAAAHGGQVLVSAATALLVASDLPADIMLLDLGEHRLKDLTGLEHVYQLTHPALRAKFPPIHTLDSYPNNLPSQLTSFVGRTQALAETKELLATTHLLTLTGSGGTGKTRLSLQLASGVLPTFADGAWLVELAPLDNPDRVVQAVAAVFELRDVPGVPLQVILTNYLRGKRLLLILDNAEHLINATAQLVDHLLQNCPKLHIIVSSREGLGITGEVSYHVPSLSLPSGDEQSLEMLISNEAAQLFLERAKAVNPHFSVTKENAQAIAQICRRLDGIPLALELAAARVKAFSVEQIAARLDDRFRLLAGGSRTAVPRQQTLRALIDWSYGLLSEPEQALLRWLSVFSGGWTFEAAESVCGALDILTLLPQLINKSLVIADEQQGKVRYRLLETIRQYARDRLLEAGESALARDCHLDFFLAFTREAEEGLLTGNAFEWLDRLLQEYDNLQAAVDWGQEQRPEDSLFLASNLIFLWSNFSPQQERVTWLKRLLSRVKLQSAVEEQATRYRKLVVAKTMLYIGATLLTSGDNAESAQWTREALALARELDDKYIIASALLNIIVTSVYTGDRAAIAAAVDEGARVSTEIGHPRWQAMFLPGLLTVAQWNSDEDAHKRFRDQARRWVNEFDHPYFFGTFMGLGAIAAFEGDYESARLYYKAGVEVANRSRNRQGVAIMQTEIVHITRRQGDFKEAREGYCKTLLIWNDLGHQAAVAHQLESMAFVERAEGQFARAATLLGAAETLRAASQQPMAPRERSEYEWEVAELHKQMDLAELDSAWADGAAMSIDSAIVYAIG